MRQGKKPTASQKSWLVSQNLNPKDWLVVFWSRDEVTLVHRTTQEVKHFAL